MFLNLIIYISLQGVRDKFWTRGRTSAKMSLELPPPFTSLGKRVVDRVSTGHYTKLQLIDRDTNWHGGSRAPIFSGRTTGAQPG